ncbi:MAG: hypothetical protein JRG96_07350 [Deltaproteobacteria bacterium]|nr:hypothetical protein [Deltaproteobacteria bacterium]MBW2418528.1 hypothetical protein [Deltaproteobacteria bacterium]
MKAGTRLKSVVCNTEVMVVMAPKEPVEVSCGGVALIDIGADKPEGGSIADGADGGTQMGKRYVNEAGDLELLCTKPGDGGLGSAGALLNVKGAKPLPSSD